MDILWCFYNSSKEKYFPAILKTKRKDATKPFAIIS